MLGLVPRPGVLPYKSDGDGRRFGLGPGNCRFWSHLGCLGWKVTIFAPFKYRLVLCINKFIKTALTVTKQKTEISLRGLFKLEPHPHWSPLAVSFEFSDKQPGHFFYGSRSPPRGCHVTSSTLAAGQFPLILFQFSFFPLILSITKFSNLFGSQLPFISS